MGFSIDTVLNGYEFRIIRSGKVEETEWMHIIVEHPETCEQSKISVPVELRPYVESLGLTKGDLIDVKVTCCASSGMTSHPCRDQEN